MNITISSIFWTTTFVGNLSQMRHTCCRHFEDSWYFKFAVYISFLINEKQHVPFFGYLVVFVFTLFLFSFCYHHHKIVILMKWQSSRVLVHKIRNFLSPNATKLKVKFTYFCKLVTISTEVYFIYQVFFPLLPPNYEIAAPFSLLYTGFQCPIYSTQLHISSLSQ